MYISFLHSWKWIHILHFWNTTIFFIQQNTFIFVTLQNTFILVILQNTSYSAFKIHQHSSSLEFFSFLHPTEYINIFHPTVQHTFIFIIRHIFYPWKLFSFSSSFKMYHPTKYVIFFVNILHPWKYCHILQPTKCIGNVTWMCSSWWVVFLELIV